MIYTFGCSATKWYWPTWSDWLGVYDQPVINLAFKAYSNENIYWALLNNLDSIKKEDHVIIMWTQSHRLSVWYDHDWGKENDVIGFFPETDGKIWFTEEEPYRGMYRTHPDYQLSLTHMIVSKLQTIYHTQLLLDKHGCNYTMMVVHNPFLDCRPVYKPKFEFVWHSRKIINDKEEQFAREILKLQPIKNLMNNINWSMFADQPEDPLNPKCYTGMWEYFFNQKKYLIYQHDTDPHPVALAHHDFALEKILKQDPAKGKFREVAVDISEQAMSMPIPEFNSDDYIAPPETKLLDEKFELILNEL